MTIAIGEIVKNIILFDLKNWRQKMTNINDFNQLVEQLIDNLVYKSINYLLVGGIALLNYVQSRNTQNIDLILSKSTLESLSKIVITKDNKYFASSNYNGLRIKI